MKKSIILGAAAIVAFASCGKMTEDTAPLREIGFQVAKYMNAPTKAEEPKSGVEYSQSASFGSYAIWTGAEGTTNYKEDFMSNVQISYHSSTKEWKSASSYYWPKTGSLDFVSYSPYTANPDEQWIAPTITNKKFAALTSGEISPAHAPADGAIVESVDLMYSDVAIGKENNTNEVVDNKNNNYSGVPTLFRHALAKLNFSVQLAYNNIKDDVNVTTSWKVNVKSLKIVNVKKTGTLSLNGYDANGVWTLPTNAIWSTTAATEDLPIIKTQTEITTDEAKMVENYFIIPQEISDDATLDIEYEIITYRDGVEFIKETDIHKTGIKLNGAIDSSKNPIKFWKMSHNYKYVLTIAPSKAKDTDNDGIEDTPIEITYDPAVADWTDVSAKISINI